MNHTVLAGTLSSEPVHHVLPSGAAVTDLQVTTLLDDGTRATVPVRVGGEVPALAAGDGLLVVGSVQRRFFRAGGITSSRTEVVAHLVVPARHKARIRRAMEDASAALTAAAATAFRPAC